ncbi:MAG: replication-associated recombination protein A [Cyclobacteriaceae bacterium]
MLGSTAPLAERLRPSNLDDFVGQKHLIGKDGILRKMIKSKRIPSIVLWGPPGVGKTTLANIIANLLDVKFFKLNAVSSGIKEVRNVFEQARLYTNPILFIDEIHRFNKSQQDALLQAVEKGLITLIGATTENPSFEVNSALLSRCQVYVLQAFSQEELISLVHQALDRDEFLKERTITLEETEALLRLSGGDGRRILNTVELIVQGTDQQEIAITNELVESVVQHKAASYDKNGDMHYDVISAFIKSMRGSDPNGAVYWLARMIEAGEDPKFIARRMVIFSSEDIGNANPTALVMATNCFQAVNVIGYPEARIILSQSATYLASSPKSNASYEAINQAQSLVKKTGDLQVPLHLRGGYTKLNKELGYGKGYKYSHSYDNNFSEQEYLPDSITGSKLYDPGRNPREEELRKRLSFLWKEKYKY